MNWLTGALSFCSPNMTNDIPANPKATTVVMTLTSGSFAPQLSTTFLANVVAKLKFANVPSTAEATRCSGPIQVTESDVYDNATTTAAGFLISGTNNVTFYNNSNCSVIVTQGVIAEGSSTSSNLYFSGTLTGNSLLTATPVVPTSITQSATATVNMISAPTLNLAFNCQSGNWGTPSCPAVSVGQCLPVYAATVDPAFQLYIPVAQNIGVALTSSAGAQVFYSDASCTSGITNNTLTLNTINNPVLFYVRHTAVGTLTINGLTSTGATRSLALNIGGGAAQKTVIAGTGPSTISTSICSGPYNVQVQDAFGNPTSLATANPVSFTPSTLNGSSLSTNAFFADSSCTQSSITLPANTSNTNFYIKAPASGALNVLAAIAGVSQSVGRGITVANAANVAFYLGSSVVSSLDFGSIYVGQSSVAQTVRIVNNSTADTAFVNAISLPGSPFTRLAASSCPTTSFQLTAGQSCDLQFTFNPTAVGAVSRTMSLTYNSVQNPSYRTSSMTLTGTGLQPANTPAQLVLQYSSINFGYVPIGGYIWQTVLVSNVGQTQATNVNISMAGGGTMVGFYSYMNTCGSTLNAGSSCSIVVGFQPYYYGSVSTSVKMLYNSSGTAYSSNDMWLYGYGY
jgi:hypothetical protein